MYVMDFLRITHGNPRFLWKVSNSLQIAISTFTRALIFGVEILLVEVVLIPIKP
jgi:hypothetical protein